MEWFIMELLIKRLICMGRGSLFIQKRRDMLGSFKWDFPMEKVITSPNKGSSVGHSRKEKNTMGY
jgi:hypothetical protein